MLFFYGALDLIMAFMIFLAMFKALAPFAVILVAAYLLIKGLVFFMLSRDFASSIDFVAGFFVLLSIFYSVHFVFLLGSFFWLFQKGTLSFF